MKRGNNSDLCNKTSYKWCAVPKCTNTSIKTPKKLFVSVPKNVDVRRKWLQLSRRDHNDIANSTNIFFCEDHFDMENDMVNYYQYKMGFSQKIILKDKVLPSKFNCQPDHIKRMHDTKQQTMEQRIQQSKQTIQQSTINNDDPTATAVEACTKDMQN
ncbi:uncharacterized protein LOC123655357 [Melitaea cinxia]|uniref:uncharacterized protein LOC123655357 n=1 Tax=Melitaea cinxia TaxID=113334 RepID=UPI001E274415|nr:uncharacterized protein LOC123655357 [Melitaea cinxia]